MHQLKRKDAVEYNFYAVFITRILVTITEVVIKNYFIPNGEQQGTEQVEKKKLEN